MEISKETYFSNIQQQKLTKRILTFVLVVVVMKIVFRTFQQELERCGDEPERVGGVFARYVSIALCTVTYCLEVIKARRVKINNINKENIT